MVTMLSLLIRLLEACFAVGLVGSVVVLILTTIEDAQELFSREKKIPE
jgi:hypothetical protein